jgi:glutaredoxin
MSEQNEGVTFGTSVEECYESFAFCVTIRMIASPLPPNKTMEAPKITAYLKTHCGWSEGVRAIFRKYSLPYEEKDIIKNPAFRWEMEQRSGQQLSPCVEVNGRMLADISGQEVESYMLAEGIVSENAAPADAPTNSSCTDEQHAAMASQAIAGAVRFVNN